MNSSKLFGPIPDGATEIAIVGEHQYLAVSWVMRREPGGQLDYYAPLDYWPTTPAAQLATRDATIADLAARIAELEELLAERAVAVPVPAQAVIVKKQRPGVGVPEADRPQRAQCPHCHIRPWPNALSHHIATAHPEQVAATIKLPAPPAPAESPVIIIDGDPTWRCAECQSATFTRSLTDPARCMRCAPHAATNGHVVAT